MLAAQQHQAEGDGAEGDVEHDQGGAAVVVTFERAGEGAHADQDDRPRAARCAPNG